MDVDTCCTRLSETAAVCIKLCFDPHCFVSQWLWRSSCDQQDDLMLLYNAEWGSDRLHKPVIGSCSHRGLSTLSRLWFGTPGPSSGGEPLHLHHHHLQQSYSSSCSEGIAAPGNQVGKQVSRTLKAHERQPQMSSLDGWMEFISHLSQVWDCEVKNVQQCAKNNGLIRV